MHSKASFFFKLKFERAFTLIELMVAVAIVAILTTFSIGEYTEHVRKSRRVDAKLALIDLAGFMERHYAIHGRYTVPGTTTDAIGLPFSTIPKDSSGADVMYIISFAPADLAPTLTTYQLNAVPREGSAQAVDKCGTLSINHLGTKGFSSAGGLTIQDCW